MRRKIAAAIKAILGRIPGFRLAYSDSELAREMALPVETILTPPAANTSGTAARVAASLDGLNPRELESTMPVTETIEERIQMAVRCRDADSVPKVANAGAVIEEPDGTRVQIMHNGIKVLAGGYYGAWMQDLIARSKGHHEPQEELVFSEIMKHLPRESTMIELGGYWSFYSIWFLSQSSARRSLIIEPDPAHLDVGRTNARLNECNPEFIPAFASSESVAPTLFRTETSGEIILPGVSVPQLMDTRGIDHLDVLHCDCQGVELAILESCCGRFSAGRVSWVVVSTHTHHISNDPLTHQRCLAVLKNAGATIVAEHDVQESFSGDGLIAAKFGPLPQDWHQPLLSYNRYSDSLFRNPLYDLAALRAETSAAAESPTRLVEAGGCFAMSGGLLTITADCALGGAGESLLFPFDKIMFPGTLLHKGWQLEELSFLEHRLDPSQKYGVLDIGANIGLFTRQIARRFPNASKFFCIEADPGNFRALQYNLSTLPAEACLKWNLALSDSHAECEFLRDTENIGNYSLNSDAMRGREFHTIRVQTVVTDEWMRNNIKVAPDFRLIWKSDTQGYDELIVSRTPLEIWNRIDFAIIELWRIKKPDFDRDAFCRRIESFPNCSIGLGHNHSTADVLEFLSGDDWRHDALYLWR